MYHERQHRQHCLKHAINNLVQREAFSIASLNKLADSIQAQRTLFLGNYDVNVLAVALELLGLELKWHDARDTQLLNLPLEQPQQQQQQPVGIVLNVAGDGWWASLTRGRHWLAIKWLHGSWWNLDSRLPAPCSFITEEADVADGGAGRLRRHLQQQLADGAHVMLVVRQQPGSTAAE
ncbi:hypothetical protein OEZ85_005263 [Tetradesmus obliquus]|uniref:ubiquitinyl hydrolase 1 n=1 Tax=Tetradesmus obliquus TaxID=3088 RepID=A0ABY8UHE8_TETOB|nr:hypothetical protein OEZ85_005263 [Tetradesmus obliquus]